MTAKKTDTKKAAPKAKKTSTKKNEAAAATASNGDATSHSDAPAAGDKPAEQAPTPETSNVETGDAVNGTEAPAAASAGSDTPTTGDAPVADPASPTSEGNGGSPVSLATTSDIPDTIKFMINGAATNGVPRSVDIKPGISYLEALRAADVSNPESFSLRDGNGALAKLSDIVRLTASVTTEALPGQKPAEKTSAGSKVAASGGASATTTSKSSSG